MGTQGADETASGTRYQAILLFKEGYGYMQRCALIAAVLVVIIYAVANYRQAPRVITVWQWEKGELLRHGHDPRID